MDAPSTTGAAIPETLGRYRLLAKIAKGGMAEVFAARSYGVHGFEKTVALKRILPRFGQDPQFVRMMVDEAKISVLLNHPNIAQILELGEQDGDYFIVMEFVPGQSLSALIKRLKETGEKVPPLEACFVVVELLQGLHAAHIQTDMTGKQAGIIHRDVSPQNLLLSFDGHVKVIDFGIARARDRLEATEVGTIKGKLRYLAPEMIDPGRFTDSGDFDHRVDVFAAGVVLFEMLAMRQRFPQQGDLEIIDAILEEETPDLTAEGVDPELQEILEQALAKERKKRFKDAAAFAGALRGWLYARDPSFTAERLAKLMRRAFTDEGDEPEEAVADEDQAPVVKKGKVTVKTMSSSAANASTNTKQRAQQRRAPEPEPEPENEETRTQFRPRETAPLPPPKKKPLLPAPVVGALLGVVLLLVCAVLIKNAMKPQQLPVDGVVVTSLPNANTQQNNTTNSTAPPATNSTAPPEKLGGLVDLGGGLEMIVEAIPATARISLAYQPDPKYVSPARLKVQRGETVDLLFEAEGYEPLRRQFVAEGDPLRFEVKLVPIPMPLVVRPIPRDAEILINGEVWRTGKKVNPGETLVINARHPFYVEKTVTIVPEPGQSVVVDITLEEKPMPVPGADGPAEDDVDRTLDKFAKATKGKKTLTGVLVVTSKPLYADVFVDGKKLQSSTPVRETLTAGSHKVTVRGKSAEKTFVVEIIPGATLKKDVALE